MLHLAQDQNHTGKDFLISGSTGGMSVVLTISEQSAVVEWLAVPFHIWKVTNLGLCPQTSCSDLVFHRFPTVCPDKCQYRTLNSLISASFYILSDSLSTVILSFVII